MGQTPPSTLLLLMIIHGVDVSACTLVGDGVASANVPYYEHAPEVNQTDST